MTDDPHPDGLPAGSDGSDGDADALASAYLDGEVTGPERAAVEADPAMLARVEAFRRVASRVGAAAPVPAGASERLLDAALAAAEHSGRAGGEATTDADAGLGVGAGDGTGAGGPVPSPLPPAAQLADRRRRRTSLPVPAVAAAVVVLLLVGLGLLITAGGDDAADDVASSGDAASERQSSQETAGPTTTGAAADEEAGGGESAPSTAPAVADLGAFADEAALRASLARVDPATLGPDGATTVPSTAPPAAEDDRPSAGEVERCDDAVRAQVEQFQGRTLDDRAAVGTADLAGRPVLVYSHPILDDPVADDQLTVADVGTCQILAVVQR